MFGRSQSNTTGLSAVFFIRSGSVDGFLRGPDGKIAYRCQAELPYQREVDLVRYKKSMLAALLDVAMRLSTEGIAPYAAAHGHNGLTRGLVILSAPWHQPFIGRLHSAWDKPQKANAALFHTLAEEEMRRQQEGLTKLLGEPVEVLAESVTDLEINGYPVKTPRNELAIEIAALLSGAAVGASTHESISEVVGKVLQVEPEITTSMQLLVAQTPVAENRYVLLEIHGEITEATLVENGVVTDRETFPEGTHELVRIIESAKGISAAEALSALRLYYGGKQENDPVLNDAVVKGMEQWQKSLAASFQALSDFLPVPEIMVLATDPAWHAIYQSALNEGTFIASQLGKNPEVRWIGDLVPGATVDYAPFLAQMAGDSRVGEAGTKTA